MENLASVFFSQCHNLLNTIGYLGHVGVGFDPIVRRLSQSPIQPAENQENVNLHIPEEKIAKILVEANKSHSVFINRVVEAFVPKEDRANTSLVKSKKEGVRPIPADIVDYAVELAYSRIPLTPQENANQKDTDRRVRNRANTLCTKLKKCIL